LDINLAFNVVYIVTILVASIFSIFNKGGNVLSFIFSILGMITLFSLSLFMDSILLLKFSVLGLEVKYVSFFYFSILISTVFGIKKKIGNSKDLIILNMMLLPLLNLINSRDLINFIISLEVLNYLMLFLLLQTKTSSDRKYFLSLIKQNIFFSTFLIIGVFLFFVSTGTFSLEGESVLNNTNYFISMLFFYIFLLFKIGIFPFHWNSLQGIRVLKGSKLPLYVMLDKILIPFLLILFLKNLMIKLEVHYFEYLCIVVILFSISGIVYHCLMSIFNSSLKEVIGNLLIGHLCLALFYLALGQTVKFDSLLLTYLIFIGISIIGNLMLLTSSLMNEASLGSINGFFYQNKYVSIIFVIFLIGVSGIPITGGFSSKLNLIYNFQSNKYASVSFLILISYSLLMLAPVKIMTKLFDTSKDRDTKDKKCFSIGPNVQFLLLLLCGILIGGAFFPMAYLRQ